jgi:hypothetical protein
MQRIALDRQDKNLALNALFLTSTSVFAERTSWIFQRITSETLINRYLWLFDPSEVVRKGNRLTSLAAHNFIRPGGYNAIALKQWHHNCLVIKDKYGGSVANFFEANGNDSQRIYEALVVKPQEKGKVGFRRFGEKLAALLIQWVNRYNLHPLTGDAGVPIDFQVGRISIQTKALEVNAPLHKNTATRLLRPAFNQVVTELGISPAEISQAFYTIGSQACNPRLHTGCPLNSVCTSLISREPFDRKGVFDPKDTGRYKS